ncbi:MAG: secretin and TonB N-terminal domain-containing protein [Candidatus Omnitrophica bacterium]|jgi:type IV pilus assembly protein PilQ|nr:secretin and TonB N-terminal domain-containing protein [Candidatus Omnitrophota bacterium]
MKKIIFAFIFVFYALAFAAPEDPKTEQAGPIELKSVNPNPVSATGLAATGNVTFDFKEADINNVLKIISYKSGVNIVTTPDVIGNVSVRLSDVPWEIALDVILKTYGFGYQRQGNVILVTKMENVAKIAAEEPLQTDIITLKFLDAQDAQKIIIPLLSPRGKTSVLYARGQKGWQFGTFKIGKSEVSSAAAVKESAGSTKSETVSFEKSATGDTIMKKAEFDPSVKSKILIITDTYSTLERIRTAILPKIDVKPKQVLIETKIIEVNRNKLKDLGFDWGLGASGAARTNTISMGDLNSKGSSKLGGHGGTVGSGLTPSLFGPSSTGILGYEPYNAGAELVFQKLTGTKFEMVVHALEDDANTNTLSAPRIMTLDNQEASMLVGYHTPILGSTVSAGTDTTGPTVTQTLDYYQEIGIRLNVVPQISEDGYINMIIHPSITSSTADVDATSIAGTGTTATTTTTSYPIIDVREAQTQVLLQDGETVVIGGLLKDVKSKEIIGIPLIKDIPWVGKFFSRETTDTQKIDLLIFITAKIIKGGEFTPEELAKLEKRLERNEPVVVKIQGKEQKKE